MEAAAVNGKAEAWRERIANQQASGLSIRAWCRQNNQPEHAFHWWRSRLGMALRSKRHRRRSSKPGPSKMPALAFAKVNLIAPPTAEPLRLRLGHERELILPASMPMSHVAELIVALERTA